LILPAYGGAAEFLVKGTTSWLPLIYESSISNGGGANNGYQFVEYYQSGDFIVPAGITSLHLLTAGRGGPGGDGAVRCGGGAGANGELKMLGTMWWSESDDNVYDNTNAIAVTPGETLLVEIDNTSTRIKRGVTVLLESLKGADGVDGVDPGAGKYDSPNHIYAIGDFIGATYDFNALALGDSSVYKEGGTTPRRPLFPGAGGTPASPSAFSQAGALVESPLGGSYFNSFVGFSSFKGGYTRSGWLYSNIVGNSIYPPHPTMLNYSLVNGKIQFSSTDTTAGYLNNTDQTVLITRASFRGWAPYLPGVNGLNGVSGFGNLGGGGGAAVDSGFTPGVGGPGGGGYALLGWHGDVPGYPYYNRSSVRPRWLSGQSLIQISPTVVQVKEYEGYLKTSPMLASVLNNVKIFTGPSGNGYYAFGNEIGEGPMVYAYHTGVAADPLYIVAVNCPVGLVITVKHIVGTISGSPEADTTMTANSNGIASKTYADTTAWNAVSHIIRLEFTYYKYDGISGPDGGTLASLALKFVVV
jgi:hypothetical protein